MKANIMCKVIEMTKVEAKKAGIVGTAEFDQLKELREAYQYPQLPQMVRNGNLQRKRL